MPVPDPAGDGPLQRADDALLLVDLQRDFMPGGALGVPGGDAVLAAASRALACCTRRHLPVFATRDWHPPDHCSFTARGGPWPPHAVAGTPGAAFAEGLAADPALRIVSKGTRRDEEAYSGFAGTDLAQRLRAAGVRRLVVAGVATDYCVLETVLDARRLGFEVVVLGDAVAAVDPVAGGPRALERMRAAGAHVVPGLDGGAAAA